MKTYKTVDGLKLLQPSEDGLMFDPVSFISYEKRLIKEAKPRKRRYPYSFMVGYWHSGDLRTKIVTIYATDKNVAVKRLERRFTNIYDITDF